MSEAWEKAEEYVLKILNMWGIFKRTKRSGASHGDGDIRGGLNGYALMVEVKDQKALKVDEWWAKLRLEAATYEGTPVLIVRRPPGKVGNPNKAEYLAVLKFEDLVEFINQKQGS